MASHSDHRKLFTNFESTKFRQLMQYLIAVIALLSFSCAGLTQTIPNGSFEDWVFENGYSDPDGWVTSNTLSFLYGADYTVTQELPGTNGDYYVKLSVQQVSTTGELLPARAFVGDYTFPSAIAVEGFAVDEISTTLTGNYRATPAPGDVTSIACLFTRWNAETDESETIASAELTITEPSGDWVDFQLPLTFLSSQLPDSCRILLIAGGENLTLGTTLEVDNLMFTGNVGIDEASESLPFTLYPNPFIDDFVLDLRKMSGACDAIIYDAQGRLAEQFRQNNVAQQISLSHLAQGLYTIQLHNGQKRWSQVICKH